MHTILTACAAAGITGGVISLTAGVKAYCRSRLRKDAKPHPPK